MGALLGRDVIDAVLADAFAVDGPVAEVADDARRPVLAIGPLEGGQVSDRMRQRPWGDERNVFYNMFLTRTYSLRA